MQQLVGLVGCERASVGERSVPLERVSVHAQIVSDFFCEVVVEQHYRNTKIETFPKRLTSLCLAVNRLRKRTSTLSKEEELPEAEKIAEEILRKRTEVKALIDSWKAKQVDWKSSLKIGDKFDCLDTNYQWFPASAVEIENTRIKIHYDSFASQWDEWVSLRSFRIAKPGTHKPRSFSHIPEKAILEGRWMNCKGEFLEVRRDKLYLPNNEITQIYDTVDYDGIHWQLSEDSTDNALIWHDERDAKRSMVWIREVEYPEECPKLEIRYIMPIPSTGVVCGFQAFLGGGTTIDGVVNDERSSKKKFGRALKYGKRAALMNQHKADVFLCELGVLKPFETCDIMLKYVIELSIVHEKIACLIPHCVTPRGTRDNLEFEDFVKFETYDVDMEIDIKLTSKIVSIASPSHKIEVKQKTRTPKHALVKVQIDVEKIVNENVDEDVLILIEGEQLYGTRAYMEYSQKYGSVACQITLCSPLTEHKDMHNFQYELVFLADVSSSMKGDAIDALREALMIFLRSLPEKVLFNIIGFNDRFTTFSNSSVPYTQETLEDASRYVNDLKAKGGTNILLPLMHVLREPGIVGYPKQIFLLTDGQVNNSEEVIKATARYAGNTRILTFGLGKDVSINLCQSVARAANGVCKFIHGSTGISEKVIDSLRLALQEPLYDIHFDWRHLNNCEGKSMRTRVDQFPGYILPIYPGKKRVVFSLKNLKSVRNERGEITSTDIPKLSRFTVKIRSKKSGRKDVVERISVPVRYLKDGNIIHSLAARDKILELQRLKRTDELIAQISSLSIKYNQYSRHTSWATRITTEIKEEKEIKTDDQIQSPLKITPTSPLTRPASSPATLSPGVISSPKSGSPNSSAFRLGIGFIRFREDIVSPFELSYPLRRHSYGLDKRSSLPPEYRRNTFPGSTAKKKHFNFALTNTFHRRTILRGDILLESDVDEETDSDAERAASAPTTPVPAKTVTKSLQETPNEELKSLTVPELNEEKAITPPDSRKSTSTRRSALERLKLRRKKKKKGPEVVKAPFRFIKLVSLQQFNGKWKLSGELMAIAGDALDQVSTLLIFVDLDPSIMSTVVALLLLEKYFSHRKSDWSIMEKKAKAFIRTELEELGREEDMDKLFEVKLK